jgi:hypothetical protein
MVLSEILKPDYDKIDFEEIIIKLEEVLAFIQKKKQEGKL